MLFEDSNLIISLISIIISILAILISFITLYLNILHKRKPKILVPDIFQFVKYEKKYENKEGTVLFIPLSFINKGARVILIKKLNLSLRNNSISYFHKSLFNLKESRIPPQKMEEIQRNILVPFNVSGYNSRTELIGFAFEGIYKNLKSGIYSVELEVFYNYDKKLIIKWDILINNEHIDEYMSEYGWMTIQNIDGKRTYIVDYKQKDILENLLISDSNQYVRGSAGHIIILNYFQKGKKLINWVLDNEKSELCLNYLIDGLSKVFDEEGLIMLVNLAYRVKEDSLINTIIKAIGNRPDDKNVLFGTLLKEYWKTEKVEILTTNFQEDLDVKYFLGNSIVYESDTLLITPVKEAIERVLMSVFFNNEKESKLRAKIFLEQRDSKIDKVWGLSKPLDILYSASNLSRRCFEFFKEKSCANFELLTSQFEYNKGKVELPYLNKQALQYLKEIIINVFLTNDNDFQWTLKLYEKFNDKAYQLSSQVLELYFLCIDRFLEIEPISQEIFEILRSLISQYRTNSIEKIKRKIKAMEKLIKNKPSQMESVILQVITKEQSMRILQRLYFMLEEYDPMWKDKALKAFKLRISKKYGVEDEEGIAIFRINALILPEVMLSRSYNEDTLSYSTEKKHVSKLNLNSCNISTFLPELFCFSHLKVLKLDDNNLKEIPRSVLTFEKLETLSIKNNIITRVPDFLKESSFEIKI